MDSTLVESIKLVGDIAGLATSGFGRSHAGRLVNVGSYQVATG